MVRTEVSRIVSFLCIVLLLNQPLNAMTPRRQPQTAPSAIPAQIAAGHSVFLTNLGADADFPIDSTRAFNDIFAAIQAHGRYQLVDSPQKADLIFQLRDINPVTSVTGYHGDISSVSSPAFQMTIIDPKTNVALWVIDSPVNIAGKKSAYNRWVSIAETNLVSRIQVLSGEPLSAAETADLTTVPPHHYRRNAIIITTGAVAVGAAAALILHHEYENGLANQKASQDAFCKANNVPLSMCAGG